MDNLHPFRRAKHYERLGLSKFLRIPVMCLLVTLVPTLLMRFRSFFWVLAFLISFTWLVGVMPAEVVSTNVY